MLDVKEAVPKAVTLFNELFTKDKFINLTLEEVDLSEDDHYWLVTFSFLRSKSTQTLSRNVLASSLVQESTHIRDYKTIKIDSETGKFISVKIRKID